MPRHDPYVIEVDCGRNYYSYKGFGYLVRHCKYQRIMGQGKRIKYKNNSNKRNNLKKKESLVVLNLAPVTTISL